MPTLHSRLVRLAYANQEIRPHLLPLLRVGARPMKVDRQEVDQLIRRFMRAMRKRPPEEKMGDNKSPIYQDTLTLTDMAHQEIDVMVAFTSTVGGGDWVRGGGYGHLKRGPNEGKPIIIIDLNGIYPNDTFANETIIRNRVLHVLMHEATHAVEYPAHHEPGKIQGRIPTEEEVDLDEYYNDPREVRAFMRELYELIASKVRKIMESKLGQEWGLGKAITRMLRIYPEWTDMEPHLTRKNKARILKGLVTAFEDEGLPLR